MSRALAVVMTVTIGGTLTVVGWAAGSARQRGRSRDGAARDYVAIGCVSREAPRPGAGSRGTADRRTFVITDFRAKDARYRLEGDPDLLERHVGHAVEVTGAISTGSSAASGPGGNPKLPTLNVTSLLYISTNCSDVK